ncbi:unnamed protein product [Arctia plantaginis]|uniref:Uncharacterized protein n=1 Tax=Arctia plantaginis TaxID=874455 RepID=A0A8S0ZC41_ARCPL|nr:unnamed protein product [Arctia plantaginis]
MMVVIKEQLDNKFVALQGAVQNSLKTAFTELQKRVARLETSNVVAAGSGVVSTVHAPSLKVPSYDGSTSWTAYRQQFQTIAAMNGSGNGYKQLLEALKSKYGERYLEQVFRAQLRDRVQRLREGLQQWTLEIEKIVRKAYLSAYARIAESNTVQAFVDGIRDLEEY